MATLKPRLTVMLEPRTHAALSRLAGLGGASIGRLIREVLSQADESLERMGDFLEQIKIQKDAVAAGELAVLSSLRVDMTAHQRQADVNLAQTFRDLEQALSAPARACSDRPGADAARAPLPAALATPKPRKARKRA